MNSREEFVRELRLALQGRISVEKIEEIVTWYENYILIQVRKGNEEAEVLSQLGEPRLLAISIIAAENAEKEKSMSENTKKQASEGTEACNEARKMNLLRFIINKIRGYYK